jgi:hypothetical protein
VLQTEVDPFSWTPHPVDGRLVNLSVAHSLNLLPPELANSRGEFIFDMSSALPSH